MVRITAASRLAYTPQNCGPGGRQSLRAIKSTNDEQGMPKDQEEPEKEKISKLDPNAHEFREGHAVGQGDARRDKGGNQDAKVKNLCKILHESPSTLDHAN